MFIRICFFRDQLNEMSQRLEEEKERRIKMENELEIYKRLENANQDKFQDMIKKYYDNYMSWEPNEQLRLVGVLTVGQLFLFK